MKMRITAALSALIIGLLGSVITTRTAQAAPNYWANTDNYGASDYSIKVGLCAGGTKTLAPNQGTAANVCKIWLPRGRYIDAWVWETGTQLLNVADCGDGRWIRFNSKTDTSRTATVFIYRISCP